MDRHIFISHAPQDDGVVKQLRKLLELHGNLAWVDSRELRAGDVPAQSREENIRIAEHVAVVVSPGALNSLDLQQEVAWALDEERLRTDGYRVLHPIPRPLTPRARKGSSAPPPMSVG